MGNWSYGDYDKLYDMSGNTHLPNNSIVRVCDWTEYIPAFMSRADTIFVDPPWNKGNMNTFYYKAGKEHRSFDFVVFSDILLERIKEINPNTVFVEMGKEFLSYYIEKLKKSYKYITFHNSTYYKKSQNKCYIIHASKQAKHRRYKTLEDLDEEDIIKWICANHEYDCIGDLCMGLGLVGKYAYLAGKSFVGTELNKKRLAVLVDFIAKKEATNNKSPLVIS